MRKLKNDRGVTLIVLVITIVVLLILAGISLAYLTGDNSIILKTKSAQVDLRASEVEEAKETWLTDRKMRKYTKAVTLEELLDELVEQEQLTEDEKQEVLETGQVTIGNRTIVFEYDETGLDYSLIKMANFKPVIQYAKEIKPNDRTSFVPAVDLGLKENRNFEKILMANSYEGAYYYSPYFICINFEGNNDVLKNSEEIKNLSLSEKEDLLLYYYNNFNFNYSTYNPHLLNYGSLDDFYHDRHIYKYDETTGESTYPTNLEECVEILGYPCIEDFFTEIGLTDMYEEIKMIKDKSESEKEKILLDAVNFIVWSYNYDSNEPITVTPSTAYDYLSQYYSSEYDFEPVSNYNELKNYVINTLEYPSIDTFLYSSYINSDYFGLTISQLSLVYNRLKNSNFNELEDEYVSLIKVRDKSYYAVNYPGREINTELILEDANNKLGTNYQSLKDLSNVISNYNVYMVLINMGYTGGTMGTIRCPDGSSFPVSYGMNVLFPVMKNGNYTFEGITDDGSEAIKTIKVEISEEEWDKAKMELYYNQEAL